MPFFQASGAGRSQFWKGVLKAKEILKWGCQVQVNNGDSTRFWEKVWVEDISLKLEFPTLYELCRDQDSLVSDYWAGDGWNIEFKRALGEKDFKEQWERLTGILVDGYMLYEGKDQFNWGLEKSGKYSTRSMYRRLTLWALIIK